MSQQSPTVFGGRYELHRRLARGGMADVFAARDQLLGRPVAVKVLFPEFAADPKFVERFRREAQAAANLNHPNIVAIYDWGEEIGTYYIVMEYVEGQSLAQILRREKTLSPEQVVRVALDVSKALGFAHEGGVVHRDVKPGNVLVSPKGEMKVADFGIATAMSGSVDSNLTQTGAVMGTATYFSPEQAQGHKVDHRSDLYSLGVVMYEMLVGRPPFSGETPVSIAYKHVQEVVPSVADQGVEVPRVLAAIIMKLLSKNPENRYPSAATLRADLDRFRHGLAVAAAPQTAAAPGVAAPPVAARTTALPTTSKSHHRPTYAPPKRRGGLIFVGFVTLALILAGFLILLQNGLTGGSGGGSQTPPVAPETVVVPPVNGRDEVDARATLEAQGFVVDSTFQSSDTVASGMVISTAPSAGSVVPVGSQVTMTVSSGRGSVEVPSLVTLNENAALNAVTDRGLKPEISRVTSSLAPEGEVVGQTPPQGEVVDVGSTVLIEVSAGAEQIEVPDVRGSELQKAIEYLTAEGFAVSTEYKVEYDTEIPRGSVVSTDPPKGTRLTPESIITLVLSEGPESLFLPSFIGFDRATARSQVEELGLEPLEFGMMVSDPAMENTVVDTIPAPN